MHRLRSFFNDDADSNDEQTLPIEETTKRVRLELCNARQAVLD